MNSASRLRQLAFLVMFVSIAASGIYLWRLSLSHTQLRADMLAQAAQRAEQLADAVAQQMDAQMHGVDFVVRQLRDQYALGDHTAFAATVRTALNAFPAGSLLQIGVIDASGDLIYSNIGLKDKIYLGDREHFRVHQTAREDQLFISKPILGRASKTWTVQFTRPIRVNDKFQGVVVVSLAPEYVATTLAKLNIDRADVVALLYVDGAYMARVPDTVQAFGKSVPAERPFIGANAPSHGVIRMVAAFDKVARTLAWQRLDHFPFVVNVGLAESVVLEPVEREITRNLWRNGLGVALVLALGATLALLLRRAAAQQQMLLEREALNQALFQTVANGLLVVDRDGAILSWNQPLLDLFAIDVETLKKNRIELYTPNGDPVPFAQLPSMRAARGEEINQELFQAGRAHVERSWVLVSSRPVVIPGDDKTLQRAVVSYTDISRPMAAEDSLRLAQSVFDAATEGIMVTDTDNVIVAVNPAFSQITGYPATDAVGQKPSFLASGQHGPEFYRAMWQRLVQDGRWEGEIANRRRDGRVFIEWLKITVVRDSQGQPRRYVALFSDVTERKRKEEDVWRQANFDALTGLPNRPLFEDRLARAIAQARRARAALALLFIDLDRFKPVNDTLGHAAGDEVLRQVARRIEHAVREEDTVARLGGDEFVVILTNVRAGDALDKNAEKIVATVSDPYRVFDHIVEISCSIGIAIYPHDADEPDALVAKADAAMYRAKEAGRGTWRGG